MRAHLPIILGEAAWFGFGGMLNAWLPVSPGWLWAGVTFIAVIGLVVFYRSAITQLYLRVTKKENAVENDHDEMKVFRRNPGHGRVAAQLVENTQNTENARSIFNDFRTAPHRVDEAHPYAAMIVHLTADLTNYADGWETSRKYEELRREIDSLTREGQAFLNFQIVLEGMKDHKEAAEGK